MLPGLDGTGDLLAPFCAAAPDDVECRVVRYPPREILGYDALESHVAAQLPAERRFMLIAESFSGPIAVRLAARPGSLVTSLVLCNSFLTPPRSPLLRLFARAPLFRAAVPERVLAALMLAPLATPELTAAFAAALRQVGPDVLAARIRALLAVDELATLRRVQPPVIYLRGTADRLVPEKPVRRIVDALPAVRVVRIAAPHAILQTVPAAAWAALTL